MKWARAIFLVAFAAQHAASNPTVTVSEGKVIGTTTKLEGATATVNKFLSVPYAVSPPERFLPPKKQSKWSKPVRAQELPPACIQFFPGNGQTKKRAEHIFNNPGGAHPQESEDCLYLNVYTPPGTSRESKLPVLFWLYGGAFIFGSSSLDFYDGSSFAYNQNVIVVTSNYRTNVFGFPNANQLPKEQQNAGMHDQRAALRWTHENIAAFGGDPSKIMLFGESAGAISVKYLLALPPKPLPFRAAIMESEAFLPVSNSSDTWKALLRSLGCSKAPSPFKCAQAAKVSQIRKFLSGKILPFLPVAEDVTVTSDIRPSIKQGTFAKVPVILGSNHDEGRPFAYILGLDEPGASLDGLLDTLLPSNPLLQRTLKTLYAGQSAYHAASDIIKFLLLQCPTSLIASFAEKHGYPMHRYFFNASFPTTSIFPDAGVWHSSEIPEVYGTYPVKNRYGKVTAQQIKLSKYMQTVWADFAKRPSAGPGWPTYGHAKNVADIGGNGISGQRTIPASKIDTQCALFDPVISSVLGL